MDPDKKKSSVRYILKDLRDHIVGRRVFPGGTAPPNPAFIPNIAASVPGLPNVGQSIAAQNAMKRAQRRLAPSLLKFLTDGRSDDQYPFTAWKGKLHDFFDSLTMGVDDTAECGWYTLDEYLTERRRLARKELREREASDTTEAGGSLDEIRKTYPKAGTLSVEQVAQHLGKAGISTDDQKRAALLDGILVPGLRKNGDEWSAPIRGVAAAIDSLGGALKHQAIPGTREGRREPPGSPREASRNLERRVRAREFWGQVIAHVDGVMADGWLKAGEARPHTSGRNPL
jgi:hypothetical protein